MNIMKELIGLFELPTDSISDNLMNVEYHNKINYNKLPPKQSIINLLKKFPNRDEIIIELSNVSGDTIALSNQVDIDGKTYNDFIEENSDPEYKIEIHIKISKTINDSDKISIYCFDSFNKNMLQKNIETIMKFFSNRLKNHTEIIFINYDNEYNFATKTISMINTDVNLEKEKYNRIDQLNKCKSVTNFLSMSDYELLPEDFYFQTVFLDSKMKEMFCKIRCFLSLIYICNISRIDNGKLYLQLNGYRNKEYVIDFEKFQYKPMYEEFFYIYFWTVCDGNVTDKMSLARNILSMHCKYSDILEIDKKTFASIKSNYDLYLRENVNQYIELKNKVVEFAIQMTKESNEIILDFISNLKKNIATFITFILGTIIANIVSDTPLDNIFTNDVVAICCWILLGSFVYLFISLKETDFKVSRYKEEYKQLKKSYTDFLDDSDINEIFENDKPYIENIKEIEKIKQKYRNIWIALITITFIAICIYKNFNFFEYVFNMIKPVIKFLEYIIK